MLHFKKLKKSAIKKKFAGRVGMWREVEAERPFIGARAPSDRY
jgi:hypothetical protein